MSETDVMSQKAVNDEQQKVDKVEGKQLSTNDYTSTEKTKLATMPVFAEKITGTSLKRSVRNLGRQHAPTDYRVGFATNSVIVLMEFTKNFP